MGILPAPAVSLETEMRSCVLFFLVYRLVLLPKQT
jgi:hypothetical protein